MKFIRLGQLVNLSLDQINAVRLGQMMLWTEEDERKHPRDESGKFTSGSKTATKAPKVKAPKPPKPKNRERASGSMRHKAVDILRSINGGRRPSEDEIWDQIAKLDQEIAKSAPKIVDKPPTPPKPKKKYNTRNWRYPDADFIATGAGGKPRFRENVAAIRTANEVAAEGREATDAEKAIMSKFTGWGQFKPLFNTRDYGWYKEREEFKKLVGVEEYKLAMKSTRYSHYTAPGVVEAHWKMAEKLGFKGGRYLDPAAGTGFYQGFMPKHLSDNTQTTMVEMEPLSGGISKALYPDTSVSISPFQDHPTPDNFYDLVATNVPFARVKIYDPKYKRRTPLHDYYLKRSVDTTKPGGLVMNITSTGTMDKLSPETRAYIDEHCELVSAIRFPGGVHQKSAQTQVVTDMLIFRKKHKGIPEVGPETPPEAVPVDKPGFTGQTVDSLGRIYHWRDGKRVPAPDWDSVASVKTADGESDVAINEYFANNPEQMLGTLDTTGSMYAADQMNVSMTGDYDDQLQGAIDRLPEGIIRSDQAEPRTKPEPEKILVDGNYNAGQLVSRDGKIYQYDNGALVETQIKPKDVEKTSGMIELRDKARAVLASQRVGDLGEAEQAELNAAYDAFVAEHGPLHRKSNRDLMKNDPDAEFLLALEDWNGSTKKADKADIFTKAVVRPDVKADSAKNVTEAVGVTLHETAVVDPERIAELTGIAVGTVEEELVKKGLAYQDPNGGWESASLYLSGETRKKLRLAEEAAKTDERYLVNVEALKKHQPPDVDIDDIGVKLGSPWLPPAVLQEFAESVTGHRSSNYSQKWDINFVNADLRGRGVSGGWNIRSNSQYNESMDVWGVKDIGFVDIFKAAVTDKSSAMVIYDVDSEGRRQVNAELTEKAQEKVETLKDMFKDWVWDDPERAEMLHRHYNDTQNSVVPIEYDGSHLTLPGLNSKFVPYSIQKDFVWRVITTGKGYAGHEVGTGKTLSMVAAAMELRRLKLANKPCMSVKSSNIAQITAEAQEAYPNAKILSMAGVSGPSARRTMLNRMSTGDYDMVIMTHDNMDMIKMKPENRAKFIEEEMDDLTAAIEEAARDSGDDSARIVTKLGNAKEKLENDLAELMKEDRSDQIYFEDLGIDQVLIDEAHRYKSLACHTAKGEIKGVPSAQSQRATRMLNKSRWLMEENDGRGVVMVSGTPVANTMAELYNVQKFLQYDDLKERGISRFDSWADQFGELTNRVEFKLDGELKPTKRFAQFINLPELRHLSSKILDIKRAEDVFNPDGTPAISRPKKHDAVHASPETDEIRDMMSGIHARATAMKGRRPEKGEKGVDNMLNVCGDAKMGSMDRRMIDKNATDDPNSKANQIIKQAIEDYHAHPGTTQCMFSDIGINPTKKTGFSLVEDMKKKLIAGGIPENEIVHFKSGMPKSARQEAQAKMKRGEYRIAFGSTETLGTGTNIQKNLKSIHHIDIPYVPATQEQREGRAYRKGNKNADINVYKYVTEGSADNIFWQILATKKHFIDQFMLGKNSRTMTELDASELTPEQMISVATGDPNMIERSQLTDQLRKLKRAETRHRSDTKRMRSQVSNAPATKEALVKAKNAVVSDYEHAQSLGSFSATVDGVKYDKQKDVKEKWDEAVTNAENVVARDWKADTAPVGSYKGLPVHYKIKQGSSARLWVEMPSGKWYPAYTDSLDSVAAAVTKLQKHKDDAIEKIDVHDQDIKAMENALTRGFRGGAKIAAAEQRLEELKRLTRTTSRPTNTSAFRDG